MGNRRIVGIFDDPNRPDWMNEPNQDPLYESEMGSDDYGVEWSGSASGGFDTSGLYGRASSSTSGGGGASAHHPGGSALQAIMKRAQQAAAHQAHYPVAHPGGSTLQAIMKRAQQAQADMAHYPAAAHPGGVPPPHVAAQLWQRHAQHRSATSRRAMLLEPNKGSAVKVERYVFAVNDTITLGTAKALSMSGQPDTNIRPQRCTINAPAPGFATISEIKVANVSVTVGGTQDAFDFSPNGVGQSLDMPTLSPSNKATVLGNYTGFVPPGYVGASSYTMCASFKGPASIVA